MYMGLVIFRYIGIVNKHALFIVYNYIVPNSYRHFIMCNAII